MAGYTIHWPEPDEERTLRYFLFHKFPDGMPEEIIAVPLESTLKGIDQIQSVFGREPEVNSGRICFFKNHFEQFPSQFRLAYSGRQIRTVGPESPGVGIWGVGIVALELAYGRGSLPENMTPEQLFTMGNNLVRILRLKLDNERKKIKKLPNTLDMLLDDGYVNLREQELIAKKNAKGIMRAVKVLESSVRSLPTVETHQKRSFSRDFLEVVMKCLDKEHPTPIDQILELPFFQNINFERILKIMDQFR